MAAYPQLTGGTIGQLLRAIQEERQQGPLSTPPQTEGGSAVRNLVQQPLAQVEAPDSSRLVSIRPETAPISGGDSAMPGVVGPVAPIAPAPIGPTAPVAPAQSGTPSPSPVPTPSPRASSPVSLPGIGTRITPTAASVLGTSTQKRPGTGPVAVGKATPAPARSTPAPNPQISRAPGPSRIGPPIVKRNITPTPIQQMLAKFGIRI